MLEVRGRILEERHGLADPLGPLGASFEQSEES
jgi:hypothetical protein